MILEARERKYRLYRVRKSDLPTNTYIFCSKASREVLYNPHTAGKILQERMEGLSEIFVDIAAKKALKGFNFENVVELVLLTGGLYYSIARGFRKVYGYALPQCFLGIKRYKVEGTEGEFKAVSSYENFEPLPENPAVIIGDTIATGSTVLTAIECLEKALNESNKRLRRLVICSLACSTEGARRIRKMEERMKEKNSHLDVFLVVAEQFFHLMPDGTDLRFLREDSLMPAETREYTLKKYGEFLGREMKCAVFDWGTRCKNPKKHYMEFIEFGEEILKNPMADEKAKNQIKRMISEAKEEMEIFKRAF
mgnify:CR=1 FL=1